MSGWGRMFIIGRSKRLNVLLGILSLAALIFVYSSAVTWKVDRLVSRLNHPDEAVRAEAVSELSGLKDEAAIDRLIHHLGDKDAAFVEEVRKVLIRIGAPAAKPAVREMLAMSALSESWIQQLLFRIDAENWLPGGRAHDERWVRQFRNLQDLVGRIGTAATEDLIAGTKSRNRVTRRCSYFSLDDDPRAFEVFLEGLKDSDKDIVRSSASSLGGLMNRCQRAKGYLPIAPGGDEKLWQEYEAKASTAVEPLLELFERTSADVKKGNAGAVEVYRSVLWALALYSDDERAMKALLTDLADGSMSVHVSYMLSRLNNIGTLARLARILEDENPAVRENIFSIFAGSRRMETIQALQEAYAALGDGGRAQVIKALEQIRDRNTPDSASGTEREIDDRTRSVATKALEEILSSSSEVRLPAQ